MNNEYDNLKTIKDLNQYLNILKGHHADIILCVAVCEEASRFFKEVDFGPYSNDIIADLEYREGFAAIINKSSNENIQERGEDVTVHYEYDGNEFSAHSGGFVSTSNKGNAHFIIDQEEFELKGNRGLVFLVFSKSKNQVQDLFSVDTHIDSSLEIKRADMKSQLASGGLDDPDIADLVYLGCKGERRVGGKVIDWMRMATERISENPKEIVPNIISRIASFYANGKFIKPNYRIASKWMNAAIRFSSHDDDDELTDDESTYYAVNQFLSKRDRNTVLSDKEAYFLNMSPAGGRLRLMQMNVVILLKIFDDICKKYGLDYWAIAGTLLGAVRHGGFIPWDDDVDVGMLRSDIYKLEKTIKENYPNLKIYMHIQLDKHDTHRHYKVSFKDQEQPFIDIFPFDIYDLPTDSSEEEIKTNKKKIIEYADIYKHKNNVVNEEPSNDEQRADFIKILFVFSEYMPTLYIDEGKSIGYGSDTLMAAKGWIKCAYDIKTVFPCKSMLFENIEIKVPKDPHTILEGYVGDYYTIPSNAFYSAHGKLSDEGTREIKKTISKYSEEVFGPDILNPEEQKNN